MSALPKVVKVHERRSSLPQEIARAILGGFDRHYELFRKASIDAKALFERAAWAGLAPLKIGKATEAPAVPAIFFNAFRRVNLPE